MYLIDKVVRAKALQGPIGVNNSEVINLEQERELRKKNIYYANLADKKGTNQTENTGEESEQDENTMGARRNSKGEFVDEEERDMNEQERENARNE